jgi:MiaB-like tRNA modifying enzyme
MSNKKNIGKTVSGKTVYIETFGCSLNYADSETMAGLLRDAGFNIITNYGLPDYSWAKTPESKKKIDVVIINSCTVKNLAESKFFRELRKWQAKDVKIVVAGCIPQADPELLNTILKDVPVIGTRQLLHTVEIVNDLLDGKIIHDINNDYNQRLNLPKIRKTGIIEILPISEGCLSNCAYCKTKFARGELLSYPKEDIIMQFKSALTQGCREFWITSQDNGCYGFDIYRKEKYFLPQLLNELLDMEGNFKIRLGMANPDNIKRIKDDLIETFKHPKMFKFLHIPIQSGNDAVLKRMKRIYTVKDYENLVSAFKDTISEITISTDIIAGFPGETDNEFIDTVEFVKRTRPDIINHSRFWLRKGTAAENMKQLYSAVIKERSEQMKKLFEQISSENNKRYIGREFTVLIDEHGKNNTLIGRNDSYKQVIIDNDNIYSLTIGDSALVKIIDSGTFDLKASLIHKL